MPVFVYKGLNAARVEVAGEVEAPSRDAAIARIRALGCFPTKLGEKVPDRPRALSETGPAKPGA